MNALPAAFTLVLPGDLGPRLRLTEGVRLLVFRRRSDGTVAVEGFPDETDVCEALVPHLDQQVVRLDRGRLYVTAANGHAVYVPVGSSPIPGCVRYGRLYLREGK